MMEFPFHTSTVLAGALRDLLQQLEAHLTLRQPLSVYLAGGMAVHLYTANRVTTDVDAEFGDRILLPNDMMVPLTLEDGTPQVIYFDSGFNANMVLLHQDYRNDAIPINLGCEKLRVQVLAPVDLAVSKIPRLAEYDREDIAALVRHGLTNADAIEARAESALDQYVGDEVLLRENLRDAVALARLAESGELGHGTW